MKKIVRVLILEIFFLGFNLQVQADWQSDLEGQFDIVETFDNLQDWRGQDNQKGADYNKNHMPMKLDGSASMWDFYDEWFDGADPNVDWIKNYPGNVWHTPTGKSLQIHLAPTNGAAASDPLPRGPSKFGMYLGSDASGVANAYATTGLANSGYNDVHYFYMIKMNAKTFPTTNGNIWPTDDYAYWAYHKFATFGTAFTDAHHINGAIDSEGTGCRWEYGCSDYLLNWTMCGSRCDAVYNSALNQVGTAVTFDVNGAYHSQIIRQENLKQRFDNFAINKAIKDGKWFGLEVHLSRGDDQNTNTTTQKGDGQVEVWVYSESGQAHLIYANSEMVFRQFGTDFAFNKFFFGGNMSYGDKVDSQNLKVSYFVDDFIMDNQRIGPNYFNMLNNQAVIRADVDQNSIIDSADALLTLRNSLGLEMSGTNWQASATTGNVNCDSNSNSTDALLILRESLGLEMSGTGWCVENDTYTLTVTDPGNNDMITATGINCGNGNTDCSEEYAENTEVILTATASAGREWVSWGGDVTGSSSMSDSVTMDANKTATANFQATSGIDCNNLSYEHLDGGTGPAAVGNSESRNAYRGVYWTGENKKICKGEFRVHVTGDVSGINYKVTLWSVDTQNDLELDTLLATSNIISGASLSDGVWMPFEFSSPQDVISGKTVFLVSRSDVGTKDGSNFIQVYQDYDESDLESRAWNSHYNISGTMEGRHPGDENQPEYFTVPLRLYGEDTALAGAAPNMPENINVTAVNSTTLNIDWIEKGVVGVDHYNVYEYNTADASKILVDTVSAPTTEYQHTGLTSGTTHYYVITAVSTSGIEGYHSVDRHQSSGDPDWEGTTL